MVSKKSSAATAPAAALSTQTTKKSSILRAAFSPSRFQLSLFASVIQGLDSQHLRIHDRATGRLRCEHALQSKAIITCLDWGYYGSGQHDQYGEHSKKKRKRSAEVNGSSRGCVVVAFGTTDSDIHMFSPSEAKVIGVLDRVHSKGIRDFKFTAHGESAEAWSSGGDGKLVQWNLRKGTSIRVLSLPNTSATTLLPLASSVLCASHTIYMVDPISPEQPVQFTGPTNFVQTLVASVSRATSGPPAFLAAMESDRSIHVFDTQSRRIIGSLVMENDVESVTSSMDDGHAQHILAVVNKEGIVEMFPSPFDISNVANQTTTATLKSQRKSTIRKAVGSIRVTLPGSITLPVINASFQDNDLWVAWTKGGIDLGFEKIQWRSEHNGGNIIIGRKDIIKSKVGANVDATVMNGVKDMGKSNVDESRTVVANGRDVTHVRRAKEPFEVIDISSGEEDDSEAENDYAQEQSLPAGASSAGKASTDIVMGDADLEACEEAEDVEEPSFGDLVRANAPEPIDVVAAFTDSGQQILTSSHETDLRLPSGMSLGTVLTQSLRTNDTNLLETCFHVRDHDMVRATIGRLDSSLATTLLRKLAERLHSRPGRAGSLMVWIQSTLVTHGGYLASQPDVVKKLTSLHRVVKERASSLQSLLALKGKLDMLETQLNLRKSMQKRLGNDPATEDDDEDAVIYVEGQEESSSEGEANPTISVVAPRQPKRKGRSGIPDGVEDGDSFDVEGEEDDMPTTMEGVIPDSEDEMSASDAGDLLDDEASETENDSGDGDSEDDVDHYSVDSIDGDEESEPEVPLSKRPTKQKLSNGIPSTKSP